MCGIVGYIGFRDAYPILIQGLKRLEYRGYDSAGVALINNEGVMNVYKEKGKVSNLEALTSQRDISGQIGIAHTRWATHGEPSAINAHPHVSQSGRLALVHNGIIENYSNLKILLEKEGYTFKSSTDTEVLVQLIEYMQKKYDKSLENAHTAEADTMATYEVLKAQLDRYPELQNDINFLSQYSSYTNNVDFAGRMVYNDKGEEVINFGKYKGRLVEEVLKNDPGYYSWIMNGDFPLNTKKILTEIKLRGFNSK